MIIKISNTGILLQVYVYLKMRYIHIKSRYQNIYDYLTNKAMHSVNKVVNRWFHYLTQDGHTRM